MDKKTTDLSKKEQLEMIKQISSALELCLDNISWEPYYTNYLKANIQDEKQHLKFKPEGVKHGLSAKQGGEYHAVKWIVESLEGHKPDAESYIFTKKVVFTAYSIVSQYRERIIKALRGIEYKEVLKMDYCELVK